jgi:hypothetical protein
MVQVSFSGAEPQGADHLTLTLVSVRAQCATAKFPFLAQSLKVLTT